MNITFLVGNGFDISAGVDTSYESFYKWYCSQDSRTPSIAKFKKEIKDDIENGGNNWSDFETGLGKYTSHFSPDNANNFLECFDDAVENIPTYLEQEKNKFDIASITENDISRLSDGVLNFYQELNPRERLVFREIFESDKVNNSQINFISFNYTDILDRCIDKIADTPLDQWEHNGRKQYIKINPQILHIHGTSNEYPILGISDEAQVANQKLLSVPDFGNVMIKSQSVASIGQPWYTQADSMLEKSQIICIWGMSLGLSDSKWWNRITKWLKAKKERHLIIFWYTKTPPSKRSVLQYNRQTDMVKNCMLDYSSFTSSEASEIKNQIHVVFNTDKVLKVSLAPIPAKELILA